ncbi:helix-turn-helix domain-containing protein [Isoptericola sp. NPDC056605]|uniref:helix-turn-helix domain-containing protein n=1 Tax=Isoptericola sp. NPDC056605 TaxID=3345876 RepID=UPI0036ADED7B
MTDLAQPRFISVETVAKELAISNAQVYTLLRTGELPAIQVGPKRVWRIERAKLEQYIEAQYEAVRASVERGDVEAGGAE